MHTLCWRTKLIAYPVQSACRALGNPTYSSRRRSGKIAFPPPRHDQQSRCRDVPNRLRKPLGLLPAQAPVQAQRQTMPAVQRFWRIRVRCSLGSSVQQAANICGNNMLTQKSATNDGSITHPTGISWCTTSVLAQHNPETSIDRSFVFGKVHEYLAWSNLQG